MNDKVKLIFLDVDGVLNCKTTKERCANYVGIEDEKLKLLKEIVDHSAAKIILTSSWKECWYKSPFKKCKQDNLANYLDKRLKQFGLMVFDKTKEENFFHRGEGVRDYLDYLRYFGLDIYSYVILDDITFDYKRNGLYPSLVKTNMTNGLTETHVNLALDILNKRR